MNEFEQLSSSSGRNNLKSIHGRIEVCHYDKETGTSHPITINANAWPAHQAHGDVQGNCSIETVTICDQTWMLKNLDVDHYRNGDPIPEATNREWTALTTGGWCYLDNALTNGTIYGKLYNWHAVNDPRGLAPAGWHIPSKEEWETLINCLGGSAVAGGKLKEAGALHWEGFHNEATNESGFTALPGGGRSAVNGSFFGGTNNRDGYWWTTNKEFEHYSIKHMNSFSTEVSEIQQAANFGASVRCIKDVPPSK